MSWRKWSVAGIAVLLAVALVVTGVLAWNGNRVVAWSGAQRDIAAQHLEDVGLQGSAPLRRTIDQTHPLQIVTFYPDDIPAPETGKAENVVALWNTLHEEDRAYTVILLIPGNILAPGQGPEWLEEQAALCAENNIPFMVQALNGETHKEWLLPMAYIEQELCTNPSFQGINAAELYNGPVWRGEADGDQSQYLADGIALMAKYGAYFLWTDTNIFGQDGNGTLLDWIEKNEVLYSAMKQHGRNICMLNKESYGDPSTYPVMLGLWLSGLIGNWGVSADWWHWQVENYSSLFGQYDALITNPWKQILNYPEVMPLQSMVMAMSMGGTCFKAEAQFFTTALYGKRLSAYEKGIHPLLQEIVQNRLRIPSRNEVLASVRTAVVGRENYPTFQYNLEQSKLYPSTPSIGLLPLLPKNLRRAEREIFLKNQIQLVEQKQDAAYFTQRETGRPEGDTYANQISGELFWVHCLENSSGNKTVTFPNAVRITITGAEHSFVIGRETGDGIYFYCNNFRSDKRELISSIQSENPEQPEIRRAIYEWLSVQENGTVKADISQLRETVITVEGAQQPVLENPGGAQILTSYDAGKTTYTIRHNGSVAFTLRFVQGMQENPAVAKPKVDDSALPRYSLDAANYRRMLEEGRKIVERRGEYTPYSFAQYHQRYEKLRVALEEQTIPQEQVETLAREMETAQAQLVSIVQVRDVLMQAEERGEQFDRLLRAVMSPTPYYNQKETELEFKENIKQAGYDAPEKEKELAAALKAYQKHRN